MLLHHSLFASSQGSHPQASRQALVSAILFQLVWDMWALPSSILALWNKGSPEHLLRFSLSLLNNTITSFFFFFCAMADPCCHTFQSSKSKWAKNPSDWAFPSVNSTPLTGFQKSWWKSWPFCLILCFFFSLDIFFSQLYWTIKDSHYPSSSVYPKLLFWHNFSALWIILTTYELSQIGYWNLRHLGTSTYLRQIILIFMSKNDLKLFNDFSFHLD